MPSRLVVCAAFVFLLTTAVLQAGDASTFASPSDLAASLTNISQSAITRDNYVSLFLTQLQLAPMETPAPGSEAVKYALVVDVNLLPDAGEQGETYSYVLDQPVEQLASASAVANLAGAFRTIFSNRPLKAFREIQIEVHLIRLDAAERERFAKVAALFGSVVQKSMFAPLANVLGVSPDAAPESKVLAFDGRFLVPTNYWTHQNAKQNGFPIISNDEPVAIAFQLASPRNNTNLVSFLKNTTNKIAQVVTGKSVVKNVDNVQGFAVFTFTKSQYSPVPHSLNDSLMELKSGAESMDLPNNYDGLLGNTKFLFHNLEPDLPSAGRESVATFLDLANLYQEFRKVDESDTPTDAEVAHVINRFSAWLSQSNTRLQQQALSGPRVRGVYASNAAGAEIYPIIVYPYGLTDPLLVSSVLWQLKLHAFVAQRIKAGKPNIQLTKFAFSESSPTKVASGGA